MLKKEPSGIDQRKSSSASTDFFNGIPFIEPDQSSKKMNSPFDIGY